MNLKDYIGAERACAGIDGFEGWMIGSVTLRAAGQRPGSSEPPSAHLRRRGPSAAVIETGAGSIRMRVLLVHPAAHGKRLLREAGHPKADAPETQAEIPAERPAASRAGHPAEPADDGTGDAGELCISRAEMERFLQQTGDTNPLHSGADAILPGFLILNRIMSLLPEAPSPEAALEFRFLSPLHPGEAALIKKTSDGYALFAAGRRILTIREGFQHG